MTAAPASASKASKPNTASAPTTSKPQVAGTVGESGDEGKGAKRPKHPLVGNSDPNVYPFASVPGDYNAKKHAPLKKTDFKDEGTFYEWRAGQLEAKAKQMREMATSIRSGGGQAAKQLLKMSQKIDEVKAKLKASGIDPEQLLAQLLSGAKA